MALSGKYTVIDEDNFQNYLKAVGVNFQYHKYTIEFQQDGDKIKVNEFFGEKSLLFEIIVGKEVEEMSITGSKIKNYAIFFEDVLIVRRSDERTIIYNFKPTGGEIIHLAPNAFGKLIFKKDD
ncbi:fatty acid-binding protein, liver-type-like [Diabrotica virgifera virgifera]|uniref:Fatty acid-binding protein, liver-type-like n=1 Tax=Diabrotica virgifera virgifera TaxID=50390 RepID=A0A6P7F8U0_DIAVI|nr:fatty acid-binding protein, liver-type-like [Diabrotica virgifera virgifera]